MKLSCCVYTARWLRYSHTQSTVLDHKPGPQGIADVQCHRSHHPCGFVQRRCHGSTAVERGRCLETVHQHPAQSCDGSILGWQASDPLQSGPPDQGWWWNPSWVVGVSWGSQAGCCQGCSAKCQVPMKLA